MTPTRTNATQRAPSHGAEGAQPAARAAVAVSIEIDADLSCWRQLECAAASELVFLFHEWEPAIRVGIHAYLAYPGRDFDSIAPAIDAAYQRIRGNSRIPWDSAEAAARRTWQKLGGDDHAERVGCGTADALWQSAGA